MTQKKQPKKTLTQVIEAKVSPKLYRDGEPTLFEQVANLADIGSFSNLSDGIINWAGTGPSGQVTNVVEAINSVVSYIGNMDSYCMGNFDFLARVIPYDSDGNGYRITTIPEGQDGRVDSVDGAFENGDSLVAVIRELAESDIYTHNGLDNLLSFVGTDADASSVSWTNGYNLTSATLVGGVEELDSALNDVQAIVGDGDFSSTSLSGQDLTSIAIELYRLINEAATNIGDMDLSSCQSTDVENAGDLTSAIIALDSEIGSTSASGAYIGGTLWSSIELIDMGLGSLSGQSQSDYIAGSVWASIEALAGGLDQIETSSTVTVEKQATAETGFAQTYVVKQGGTQVGVKINIPKDFLVKSATLETVSTADQPVAGYVVGQKYIDFVVNTVDSSETAQHIYLLVNDLVDVYTAQANAAQVQLAIDSSNVISASIVAGSIGTTELSSGVNASLALADTAIQGATDTAQIDMTVTDKNISATIKSGSVGTTELSTGVNASLALADTAIQGATDSAQIDMTVTNKNISATIIAGSVTATELANDAVTTAKILDANVTTAKLADDAVTAAKIADGAVGTAAIAIEDEDVPGDIYSIAVKNGRLIVRKIASAGN